VSIDMPVRPPPLPAIFISYRHSTEGDFAGRLYQHLLESFGTDSVFFDANSIRRGEDFTSAIDRVARNCRVALIVVGPHWAEPDDDGGRRLDDPNDWVRLEVETLLGRQVPVIPVLVGGAHIPDFSALPISIAPLSRRAGVAISDEAFAVDVAMLVERLESDWGIAPTGRADVRASGEAGSSAFLFARGLRSESAGKRQRSLQFFQKAAQQGDPMAQITLGLRLEELGRDSEASRWIVDAAAGGDPMAERILGLRLAEGKYQKAFAIYWIRKAAGHGDAVAQRMLREGLTTQE
jgi:hypothetical protein